jgi:multisubunit Na+/H+ antiporter MnhB subunit
MILLIAGILLHYMTYDESGQKSRLSNLVGVTGLSSLSLSVAYYEPRVPLFDEPINPAYPQMQPIDRMDFVYEK